MDIQFDIDSFTLGDLENITEGMSIPQLRELIERASNVKDARSIKLRDMRAVREKLYEAVREAQNPKDEAAASS